MPADSSLISVTAKLAAYYRQFSDIPFAREVAKRIGAEAAFDQILREHGLEREKLNFYAPMFEARYKSITQLILQSGASQVLELASGYSLRGLDLARSGSSATWKRICPASSRRSSVSWRTFGSITPSNRARTTS
jgi:hypothetical protein